MKNYIADGHNEAGYIAEQPGIYSACRFKYRRMLHLGRSKYADDSRPSAVAAAKATYDVLSRHIVEWDVLDASGAPLPITAKNVALLAPDLIMVMFNIVAGMSPSDADPQNLPVTSQAPADEFDALLEQSAGPLAAAEADAKN